MKDKRFAPVEKHVPVDDVDEYEYAEESAEESYMSEAEESISKRPGKGTLYIAS